MNREHEAELAVSFDCSPYCECAIDEQCPGWHNWDGEKQRCIHKDPTQPQTLKDMLERMEEPILTSDQLTSIHQKIQKYESYMGRTADNLEQRALMEMALRPVPTPETGVKYDHGKVRWDLFPPGPLEEIGKVLTFGATKYDDDNWKKVDGWKRRYFAASMRHLWAYWRGEEKDPETGLSHLSHAMCCIIFLLGKEMEKEE